MAPVKKRRLPRRRWGVADADEQMGLVRRRLNTAGAKTQSRFCAGAKAYQFAGPMNTVSYVARSPSFATSWKRKGTEDVLTSPAAAVASTR